MRLAGLLSVAVGTVAPAEPGVASLPAPLETFLRRHIRLSEADLDRARRGDVVARVLESGDRRELAIFGLVRVAAPPGGFVEAFRDIERFKRGAVVLQIGRFSPAPALADLEPLTLEPEDLEALRRCRVGDCKVQLPARAIEQLRRQVDWRDPQWASQVTRLFKEMLLEHVRAYLADGDQVLAPYADRDPPVHLADAFQAILGASPYLLEYVPEFHRYLAEFPRATLPGAEEFLYWSKEKFGLKPVISVTHVVLYQRSTGTTPILIASKQIYASHYFQASLGLTAVVPVHGAEGDEGFYLMYLNRSRVPALGRLLARVFGSTIRDRARDGIETSLQTMKARLEAGARAAGTGG